MAFCRDPHSTHEEIWLCQLRELPILITPGRSQGLQPSDSQQALSHAAHEMWASSEVFLAICHFQSIKQKHWNIHTLLHLKTDEGARNATMKNLRFCNKVGNKLYLSKHLRVFLFNTWRVSLSLQETERVYVNNKEKMISICSTASLIPHVSVKPDHVLKFYKHNY